MRGSASAGVCGRGDRVAGSAKLLIAQWRASWRTWRTVYECLLTPVRIRIWIPWPRWSQLLHLRAERRKRYRCVHCGRQFGGLEVFSSIWVGRVGEYACTELETVGLCSVCRPLYTGVLPNGAKYDICPHWSGRTEVPGRPERVQEWTKRMSAISDDHNNG